MYLDDIYAMTPVLPEDSILLTLPFAGAVLRNIGVSRLEVELIMEDVRKANIIDEYDDEDDQDDDEDNEDVGDEKEAGGSMGIRGTDRSSISDNSKNRRRIGKFGLIDIFRRTISTTNSARIVSSASSSSPRTLSKNKNDEQTKVLKNRNNNNDDDDDDDVDGMLLDGYDSDYAEKLTKKDATLIEGNCRDVDDDDL
jgi:hypothetical protein